MLLPMIFQLLAGALQMCAGHDAGSKADIHIMRMIFEDDNIHTALPFLMLKCI